MIWLQDILLEQRSLNQQLQAQLAAAKLPMLSAGCAAAEVSPMQQRRAALAHPAVPGSASGMDFIGALPADAAELATLQQRISYLEAQNATLRRSAASGLPAAQANMLPAPASNAAELATLQQRIGYLEAQNATLRAAAAEARAAAAAAGHNAFQADAAAAAGGLLSGRSSAETGAAAAAYLAPDATAALPPQHVRWEEQRKLQRQVDTLRAKLRVSAINRFSRGCVFHAVVGVSVCFCSKY